MAIIKTIESGSSTISVWKIDESADQLIHLIDERIFDSFAFAKITHPERKREWLASRALLSIALKEKQIDYSKLCKDNKGKPFLENCKYKMSISHSHKYCAVILSENNFVGVDIESNFEKAYKLRSKFMNDLELELTKENIKTAALIWSAKETIYKAYGKRGLIFKDDMEVQKIDSSCLEMRFNVLQKELQINYEDSDGFLLSYLG